MKLEKLQKVTQQDIWTSPSAAEVAVRVLCISLVRYLPFKIEKYRESVNNKANVCMHTEMNWIAMILYFLRCNVLGHF